jgi:hypothetical protein
VVQLHSFLTSALDGSERLTSRPSRFTPGKEPRYILNRGWVGPRTSLDALARRKSLESTGSRAPDRPVRSLFVIPTTLLWLLGTFGYVINLTNRYLYCSECKNVYKNMKAVDAFMIGNHTKFHTRSYTGSSVTTIRQISQRKSCQCLA